MKKTRSKRFITLLELLIVFAIIALVTGIGAFNMKALFSRQAALSEMDKVMFKLRASQEVMALLNTDIELKFKKEQEGFSVEWAPKGVLHPTAAKLLGIRKEIYPHIQEIYFEDGVKDLILKDQFSLSFLSNGFLMNRGVLQIKAEGQERFLLLPGYPWELTLTAKRPHYAISPELQDWIRTVPETVVKAPK